MRINLEFDNSIKRILNSGEALITPTSVETTPICSKTNTKHFRRHFGSSSEHEGVRSSADRKGRRTGKGIRRMPTVDPATAEARARIDPKEVTKSIVGIMAKNKTTNVVKYAEESNVRDAKRCPKKLEKYSKVLKEFLENEWENITKKVLDAAMLDATEESGKFKERTKEERVKWATTMSQRLRNMLFAVNSEQKRKSDSKHPKWYELIMADTEASGEDDEEFEEEESEHEEEEEEEEEKEDDEEEEGEDDEEEENDEEEGKIKRARGGRRYGRAGRNRGQ